MLVLIPRISEIAFDHWLACPDANRRSPSCVWRPFSAPHATTPSTSHTSRRRFARPDYPRGQLASRSRLTPRFDIGGFRIRFRPNPPAPSTEFHGSPASLPRQLANAATAFYAARQRTWALYRPAYPRQEPGPNMSCFDQQAKSELAANQAMTYLRIVSVTSHPASYYPTSPHRATLFQALRPTRCGCPVSVTFDGAAKHSGGTARGGLRVQNRGSGTVPCRGNQRAALRRRDRDNVHGDEFPKMV